MSSNHRLLLATTIGFLSTSFAAIAQQSQTGDLEEILVTAQRRTEVLENVPMSVTVASAQTITEAGITNFMDLGQVLNGVQMNYAGSVPGIAVRGISSEISGYNIEANVAIYIDGIYDPQPLTMATDIANLESIEVLKGPQGTLWGRNATGGAVLVNTLGPSSTFTGKFDASYGTYDDVTLNGYVAGPISDGLRYSLSGHYQHGDTTFDKSSPTVIGATVGNAATFEEGGGRGKLQADLTDNLEATLGLNASYHNDPRADFYSPFGHNAILPPPPITPSVFGTEAYVGTPPKDYAYQYEPTLKLEYKNALGTLTSYTAYDHRKLGLDVKFDGSYVTGATFGYPPGSPEYNQPFLLSTVAYDEDTVQESIDYAITAINRLDLNVGGLYYSDDLKTPPGQGAASNYQFGDLQSSAHTYQHTRSWAGYVDGTYHVTDQLSLNVGGRYSTDYRQEEYDVTGPAGVVLTPVTIGQHNWSDFTPRVTVRYELAPRTDIYFSRTEGYRQGAYNPSGPICSGIGPAPGNQCVFTPARPETITSYEVGFKTAWSRIRFTTALFHYDYKDLQIVVVTHNPFNPLQLTSQLESAPSATVNGWESELTANATEHLTLHGALTILHAEFGSFPNASGTGVNAANTVNVSGQTQDWSSEQLARAPDWSGHVGFDYNQPLSRGSLFFTTNLNFTDRYVISDPSLYGPTAPVALQRQQRFLQSPYALLSAQLSWTDPSSRYTVTAYGNNLTNHTYRTSYDGGPFGDFTVKADPVTGGVKFGYKF